MKVTLNFSSFLSSMTVIKLAKFSLSNSHDSMKKMKKPFLNQRNQKVKKNLLHLQVTCIYLNVQVQIPTIT